MAYQALYRKYRSQTFGSMIGQEIVTTTLKNAIVNEQISHAYLFSGPRGTGKTSAAKIFAKAINCPNQVGGEPCNICDICTEITRGTLEDVIELDAASNNGVDEIREIRDKSTYAAAIAKYKVYIIDEVHMLSAGAFNALLKTLEEPTPGVVFVLATTELQKIPATIISRVQRFAFKSISTAEISGHLQEVMEDENLSYETEALDVIARSAEGGMRDALSLLDQALSFSEEKLVLNDALLVTGAISNQALVDYISYLEKADSKSALEQLNTIFAEGKNMLRFTEDLLGNFRDLLFDEKSEISHKLLYRWIDIAIDSLKALKETTQTKIVADVMTMRLSDSKVALLETEPSLSRIKAQTAASQSDIVVSRGEEFKEEETVEPATILKSKPKASSIMRVSRDRVLAVLDEAVANPDAITKIKEAWGDVLGASASPRDLAVLKSTRLAAASTSALILTVEHENLVKLLVGNPELTGTISSTISDICGFQPEVLTLAEGDWREIRAVYASNRRTGQILAEASDVLPDQIETEAIQYEDKEDISQLAQQLFGDKVNIIND
ncbi:DNA polymerase III subunit gamma/tau [Lactovum miscens]|uniref:DNA-directed DNA polymerase n=1 Tax=Lactovum miscens TaxID=190387 RepID=A0A841C203_9LACT|nr:DNA polymerase III subunit gamma/tau [Lactovum miscens]MBB5887956.1 DNA polymerase-3 subunit gamma/tau [Lactovum miscens]